MESNIEKLMRKRVIVTNWYPRCGLNVGDILILIDGGYWKYDVESGYVKMESSESVEKATANFRELHWSEHRAIEDMPIYIKRLYNDGCHVFNIDPASYLDKSFMKWRFGASTIKDFKPATAEDYHTFTQNRK